MKGKDYVTLIVAIALILGGLFVKVQPSKDEDTKPDDQPAPVVVVDGDEKEEVSEGVRVTHDAFVAYSRLMAANVFPVVAAELDSGKIKTQQEFYDRFTQLQKEAKSKAFAAKWDPLIDDAIGEDRWDPVRAAELMRECQKGAATVQ